MIMARSMLYGSVSGWGHRAAEHAFSAAIGTLP